MRTPPAGPPPGIDVEALVTRAVKALLSLMLGPAERAEADATALAEERALKAGRGGPPSTSTSVGCSSTHKPTDFPDEP